MKISITRPAFLLTRERTEGYRLAISTAAIVAIVADGQFCSVALSNGKHFELSSSFDEVARAIRTTEPAFVAGAESPFQYIEPHEAAPL